jgi:hypothetical protein
VAAPPDHWQCFWDASTLVLGVLGVLGPEARRGTGWFGCELHVKMDARHRTRCTCRHSRFRRACSKPAANSGGQSCFRAGYAGESPSRRRVSVRKVLGCSRGVLVKALAAWIRLEPPIPRGTTANIFSPVKSHAVPCWSGPFDVLCRCGRPLCLKLDLVGPSTSG